MPRKPRLDIPGLLQHVIVRGIEKCDIFLDDEDRSIFLSRFSNLLEETGTDCFAWSIMTNHFHLLLRCNQTELSRFMRRLLTGYAINFNHRHNRSGHLFQNRYKSIVCEEDAYLLELVRYIHLNPLRAKIVPDLEALDVYSWSGHAVLMGKIIQSGQVVDEVLLHFGKRLSTARKNYRRFIADGVSQGRRPELVGGGLRRSQKASGGQEELESFDDRILGGGAFVESLQKNKCFQSLIGVQKVSFQEVQKIVSNLFEVSPETILRRSRKKTVSEARAVFCYIMIRLIGKAGTEVGKFISIGTSSVSRSIQRGEQILRDRPKLRKSLDIALKQ